jgi:uncharacterized membrane protein
MTTNDPPPYPGDSPGSDDSSTGSADSSTGSGDSSTSGLPSYGSVQPPEGTPPPPPPPPPPSAPGGSVEAFSATDAVGYGWRKFTENVGPIVVAGLIVIIPYFLVSFVGSRIVAGNWVGSLIVSLIAFLVLFVGGAVIARAAFDVADGNAFNFGAAASKVNFGNLIVAGVVVGILQAIGLILLVVPAIIVIFLSYFTAYFIVDENAEPIQAISDSVKLITSRFGDSLLLALLNFLVLLAGGILLLVGLVVAYPVTVLASVYAFRHFRGQPVAS